MTKHTKECPQNDQNTLTLPRRPRTVCGRRLCSTAVPEIRPEMSKNGHSWSFSTKKLAKHGHIGFSNDQKIPKSDPQMTE
jgi:hypothetical protein